jgi:regulator of sigma E protease
VGWTFILITGKVSFMNTIFDFLNSGVQSLIPFVALLGILIFVHELGHFLVARLCKVKVEVFSLGFGKKILQKKVGDTTYAISLIPLGGYVKMFGDELGKEISEEEKAVSFLHKTVWQRMAIVLAGPIMNLIFAFTLFAVIAWKGESRKAAEVGDIKPGTQAYTAGFRSGDKILSVQGNPIQTWDEFQNKLLEFADQTIQIEVQSLGFNETRILTVTPERKSNPNPLSLNAEIGDIEGLQPESLSAILGVRGNTVAYQLGFRTGDEIKKINDYPVTHFRDLESKLIALQGQDVTFTLNRPLDTEPLKYDTIEITLKLPSPLPSLESLGIERPELFLAEVLKDTPAFKAGLKPYDRILAINDKIPSKWEDVLNTVKSHTANEPLVFKIEREGQEKVISIAPQETELLTIHGQAEKRKTVGIVPLIKLSSPSMTTIHYGLGDGLVRAFERCYEVSLMTVLSFVKLIQNKISPKTIGGVISIGQAASQTFRLGMQQFLTMMAIISINLFILNLLPIPVLDGGHLLFYIVEAIRGAPLSMKKMEIAQQVGLVVLLGLMGFALFNDLSRLFGF